MNKENNIKNPHHHLQDKIKGNWKIGLVHHWKYYLPPARASPSDLEFIKNKILEKINKYQGDKSKVKLLVLGSTSEYRNLCGEMGITCYCFDFSEYNFEYLGKEVKNIPEEIFVEGNWLDDIPKELELEKFDIILADNVLNITVREHHQALFETISRLLKEDGLFMPRSFIKEKGERITPEEVIKKYREEGSKKPLFTWIGWDLYVAAYEVAAHKEGRDHIFVKEIWKFLVELHEKKLITDDELAEFNKLSLEDRNFYFYIPVKEELDESLKEKFEIKEIYYATEPYCKNKTTLHVLVKK